MPSQIRASRTRQLARPLVSAVSLAGVLWWALHQQAPQWPTSVESLLLLTFAVCVYAGVTAVRGVRWYAILRRAGVQASLVDSEALIVVGYMGNTVLPARGGELLRIFLLGQCTGASRLTILGTIVAERVLDVLVLLLLFGLITTTRVPGAPRLGSTVAIAAGGLCVLAFALSIFWWRSARTSRRAGRRQRLARQVSSVTLATRNLLSAQGLMLVALTSTLWLGEGLAYWLVGEALHLRLSVIQGCFLVILSSLAAVIPAAPGYAGTYDAAIQLGLETLHVQGEQAISFGLLVRLVIFGPITVAGLMLMVTRYGGLSTLRQVRREAASKVA